MQRLRSHAIGVQHLASGVKDDKHIRVVFEEPGVAHLGGLQLLYQLSTTLLSLIKPGVDDCCRRLIGDDGEHGQVAVREVAWFIVDDGKHPNDPIPRLQGTGNGGLRRLIGSRVPTFIPGCVSDDSSLLVAHHPAYQSFFGDHVGLDFLFLLHLPVLDDHALGDIAHIVEYV